MYKKRHKKYWKVYKKDMKYYWKVGDNVFYRKTSILIEDHLQSDSKKILLIDGARQIGKSYILLCFYKNIYF